MPNGDFVVRGCPLCGAAHDPWKTQCMGALTMGPRGPFSIEPPTPPRPPQSPEVHDARARSTKVARPQPRAKFVYSEPFRAPSDFVEVTNVFDIGLRSEVRNAIRQELPNVERADPRDPPAPIGEPPPEAC